MGQIVILDENTANKIAAGEVVERPSSVVKELVENAMDAKATAITVEIKNGGITYIRISDNGMGFAEDDVELAFERYATSKIRTADDIEKVITMGFRGEALPSIASVSKVKVTTRRTGAEYGRTVEVHGGRLVVSERTGCPFGTTMTVSELFYNIPARYKFLKKDSSEAAQISELIGKLAISRPDISFKLISQNKNLIYTPGTGDLKDAIYTVMGKEILDDLMPISYELNKIKISGFAGAPQISRSNRNFQLFFINRRFIKNRILYMAVEEAYKSYMMKRKYPVAILNISMDPSLLDVNAHPTKTEVRFMNENDLFSVVYHAILTSMKSDENKLQGLGFEQDDSALTTMDKMIDEQPAQSMTAASTENMMPTASTQTVETGQTATGMADIAQTAVAASETAQSNVSAEMPRSNNGSLEMPQPTTRASEVLQTAGTPSELTINASVETPISSVQDRQLEYENAALSGYQTVQSEYRADTVTRKELSQLEGPLSRAKYLGQAFNTYIILEKKDMILLVDQHAAHERIIFERLKKQFEQRKMEAQLLLEPVTVRLMAEEMLLVKDVETLLRNTGFEVEDFGFDTVLIREVPIYLERKDIKDFFLEVLEIIQKDLAKGKLHRGAAVFSEESLYDVACKAAIKANKKVDTSEVEALIGELEKLQGPLTCPHGRPLYISLTKYELEKKFKRIV